MQTIAMLRDHPVESLSLRKLAREAGVSHNAPYMHFKDKEALLAAVSDHGFVALTQALVAARRGASTWEDAVMATGQAYVRFILDNAPLAEVMFRPRVAVAEGDADAKAYGNSGAADSPGPSQSGWAMFLQFVELVTDGQSAGRIGASPDPRQEALYLWSLLHGVAGVIRATRADPVDAVGRSVDDQVARHLAVALKGMAP